MKFFKRRKKKKSTDSPKMVLLKQAGIGFLLTLLVTGVGFGIWHGSRVVSLTLIEISVLGGDTVSHEKIGTLVEEQLVGEYFKLVPRRFAWTYSHDSIVAGIQEIDRVKNVHVERMSGTELGVVFEEYRPIALWCTHMESKECLFLDKEGYAFAAAPWLEGAAFMRYSENGRSPTLHLQAFPGTFIEETNLFVRNLYNQLGLNIIHVEQTASDELAYHVSGGGIIKVTTRITTQETLENLESILVSEEFSHLEPGNFKYIDLRYGNKIFINEEWQEKIATSTIEKSEDSE